MSSISSVTTSTPLSAGTTAGDNGAAIAGGVDFDTILQQLYAIENDCNKAVGQLTQEVEQLARNGEATATTGPAAPSSAATEMSDMPDPSSDIATDIDEMPASPSDGPLLADTNNPDTSRANYLAAAQSYAQAKLLPDLNAALFATRS